MTLFLFFFPEKLQEGLSFEKILDDVRETVVDGDDIKRIHLLSRRDINNISKAFKINKKEVFNKDEGPNINAWVQSMETLGKDSPVIFFKKKHSEHIMLKNYDYLLVIMTKVQQMLLESCSHKVVCLDDIRITQSYNFHLVTLMTIDDSDIACPLAYGIANKVDENVISLILEIINSKVGRITTNIFMSSDIPAFYSTWQKHMGPANTHLLCTWQVDKDWRKALDKLSCSKEKKGRIYKSLKQLMVEPNFKLFRSRIDDILKQLEADPELKPFWDVFETKYAERNELWATCYRSQQVLHYGAILELVHKNLVECYEEGRVLNSFVKPLNSIFRFSRDKVLEKLQKVPKEFQSGDLGNICLSNEEIQEIALMKTDVSEKLLLVPVVERDGCFVEYNSGNICPSNCVPLCHPCSICFHKFTCTCVENFVNLNICSHVLASVNMMKNQCGEIHKNEVGSSENPETELIKHEKITRHEIFECMTQNTINANTEEEMVVTSNHSEICDDNEESFSNFDVDISEQCVTIESDKEFLSKHTGREQDGEQSKNDCINEEHLERENECCNEKHTTKESDRSSRLENECSKETDEKDSSESEAYKSFLLQKVVFIHDMLNNRTFKPEEYKVFDEYLDKIIVVSSYSSQ